MAIQNNETTIDFNGALISIKWKTGGEIENMPSAGNGANGQVFIENEFGVSTATGNIVLSNDPDVRATELANYQEIYRESLKGNRYNITHKQVLSQSNGAFAGIKITSAYGSIDNMPMPTGDRASEKEVSLKVGFGNLTADNIA